MAIWRGFLRGAGKRVPRTTCHKDADALQSLSEICRWLTVRVREREESRGEERRGEEKRGEGLGGAAPWRQRCQLVPVPLELAVSPQETTGRPWIWRSSCASATRRCSRLHSALARARARTTVPSAACASCGESWRQLARSAPRGGANPRRPAAVTGLLSSARHLCCPHTEPHAAPPPTCGEVRRRLCAGAQARCAILRGSPEVSPDTRVCARAQAPRSRGSGQPSARCAAARRR